MTRALLATILLWAASAAGEPQLRAPTATVTAGSAEPARAATPSMSAVPETGGFEDRERVVLPPRAIPLEAPPPDRRPVYVGLGLVVMAAALYWNRRQRDRFDREDDRARRPRRARDAERDADADDLHAAARGDAPDPDAPRREV